VTTYTIISAQYANPDHTSAVIITEEAAAVAISEIDTPDLWVAMLGEVTPAAYEPPAPPPAPTKAELQAQLDVLAAQIAALP
jgi:hypothetical protein